MKKFDFFHIGRSPESHVMVIDMTSGHLDEKRESPEFLISADALVCARSRNGTCSGGGLVRRRAPARQPNIRQRQPTQSFCAQHRILRN